MSTGGEVETAAEVRAMVPRSMSDSQPRLLEQTITSRW